MKSLSTTVVETPKTSIVSLLITLVPFLLEQFTNLANTIGIPDNVMTIVGVVVGVVMFVLNYLKNNSTGHEQR